MKVIDMIKKGYIYILTNHSNTVLNIGVTSSLKQRVYQHKNMLVDGFSKSIVLINWYTMK